VRSLVSRTSYDLDFIEGKRLLNAKRRKLLKAVEKRYNLKWSQF
jgi:hypothetical protein